jgi:general secretion pathway protein G
MQITKRNQCAQRSSARSHKAFTLMEVLLVLVILVVLGAIVVPMFSGIGDSANVKAATTQVGFLENAIDMFKFETKQLPGTLEDLVEEPSDAKLAKNWSGPYMKANKDLVDPWDNPYKYDAKGKKNQTSYDVWSTGPDGQDGTADDIGNWKEKE